jgi:ribonuclease D
MDGENFQICDRDLPENLLSKYLQAEAIAVDTETMGLIPARDRLCLVQLADEDYVTVIRIEKGQTSAPNLQKLMEAQQVLKIFHFARFDVATLKHHLKIQVNPIFCTKIASKLARTYSSRHGLKELVMELDGVELDKSAQCSDWGNAQGLSESQLKYAAGDVTHLLSLRRKLIGMLQREERWELAQQCFQCIPVLVNLDLWQYKDLFEH